MSSPSSYPSSSPLLPVSTQQQALSSSTSSPPSVPLPTLPPLAYSPPGSPPSSRSLKPAEEGILLPRSSSDESSSSEERKSSGSRSSSGGSGEEGRRSELHFLPSLSSREEVDSSRRDSDDLTKKAVEAPFMQRGYRMSGLSYASSSGSGSLSVPKGSHSPRRESSVFDFSRASMLIRPQSYAHDIGFDPEAGVPHGEMYETGPEGDDWMFDAQSEKGVMQKMSTSYGNGRLFTIKRAGNVFCLLLIIVVLLCLFIALPIADGLSLHTISGTHHYHSNPVARPLGSYLSGTIPVLQTLPSLTFSSTTSPTQALATGTVTGIFGR